MARASGNAALPGSRCRRWVLQLCFERRFVLNYPELLVILRSTNFLLTECFISMTTLGFLLALHACIAVGTFVEKNTETNTCTWLAELTRTMCMLMNRRVNESRELISIEVEPLYKRARTRRTG